MQTHDMAHLQQTMLDRYRLLQRLGHGSMGEVWEAEDTELARHVALKLLSPVLRQEEDYLRAFANEARLASQLDHPHILPIHDFGEMSIDDEIITYLVYPLITSGSLRDLIHQHEGGLPVALSLHYIRQAAEAIDFAHDHGLIHRAIKPSNLLLQDQWLFLSDFALARLLTTTTYRSRTHAGTSIPEYMAPEQIQGYAKAASDRYSLTIIAYQLLTGHVPFHGQNPYDVFLQHLHQPPPAPRQFNQNVPQEVEDILLKGLAKDPEARYGSCLEFVEALDEQYRNAGMLTNALEISGDITPTNHSSGQAAHTRHPWKLPRRSFLVAGTAAAVFLAGSGAALLTLTQTGQRVGPQQFMSGKPILKLTGHTDAVMGIHWRPQGRYLASTSLDTHLAIWDIDTALAHHIPYQTMLKSWKFVNPIDRNSVNWSPDGQTFAIAQGKNILSDQNLSGFINMLPVADAQKPTINYRDGHDTYSNQYFMSVTWSPDASWIAATMQSNISDPQQTEMVALWRVGKTQAIENVLQNASSTSNNVYTLIVTTAWSADGTYLAGWRNDFKLVIWQPAHSNKPLTLIDLPTRSQSNDVNELAKLNGELLPMVSLYWSSTTGADGGNLLAVTDKDIIAIFDQRSNKFIHMLGVDDPLLKRQQLIDGWQYDAQITGLSWSSNGRYIAGGYLTDKKIFIWDLQNPHPQIKDGFHLPEITFGQTGGHSENILDVAWSPDGRYLASSSFDKTIIIWLVDKA